ncbi:nitroreductase [Frateuria sp. Soil773]|uniref:nitroreductase family protein n=1 Tax=Frateuria sp. Soil773 TaxID=1736407 RepID=UPI0006F63B33|nr:nitroreductase [Frateuria sp. Soil773]KRE90956.1 nitroreductase [Frateuria sp. Soil773]
MPASPAHPLALLQQRHSAPSRQLGEPAPSGAELQALLEAAIRVPDHGKLVPFRLIELRGAAKLRFGERLAERAIRRDPDLPESKREKERLRYTFAPLVIVVVACIDAHSKVPPIEQQLSAGCVAHNLLLGAYALGYGAQWLTGWAAYDAEAAVLLGLAAHEQVIGFVHIGTPQVDIPDRDRPALGDLLTAWSP